MNENDKLIEELAADYASQVSTSRRVTADLFIGNREFTTITEIVKAAFIDGFKSARKIE